MRFLRALLLIPLLAGSGWSGQKIKMSDNFGNVHEVELNGPFEVYNTTTAFTNSHLPEKPTPSACLKMGGHCWKREGITDEYGRVWETLDKRICKHCGFTQKYRRGGWEDLR